MYSTQDYLKLSPFDAVIAMVNDTHRLELFPKTTQLVAFTPLAGNQVEITLKANRSQRSTNLLPAFEQDTFTYWRLDLGQYFGPGPVSLPWVITPCNTDALVAALSEKTGVVFDVDDIIFQSIQDNDYILKANPKSLRWVGQVAVEVPTATLSLSDVVVQRNYPDTLAYPARRTGLVQGPLLSMPYSFSAFREELSAMRVGAMTVPPRRLAAIISQTMHLPWVCSDIPAAYNIASGVLDGTAAYEVVYHDYARLPHSPRRSDTSALRLVVLRLSDTLSTNVAGHLLLHYE